MNKLELSQNSDLSSWQQKASEIIQHPRNQRVAAEVLQRTINEATVDMEININEKGITLSQMPEVEDSPNSSILIFENQTLEGSVMIKMARKVDAHLPINLSTGEEALNQEYENFEHSQRCIKYLALVLYKYFGEQFLDLTLALWTYGMDEKKRQEIYDLPLRKQKGEILYQLDLVDLNDERINIILEWTLGDTFYKKLSEKLPVIQERISKLIEIFKEKETFRKKLLEALQRFIYIPDTILASSLSRQSLRTFVENAEEVTSEEWLEILEKQILLRSSHREGMSFMTEDFSTLWEIFEKRQRLKSNENQDKDNIKTQEQEKNLRQLREVIGCERLRQELSEIEFHPDQAEAKEMEIIARVFAEVSKYEPYAFTEDGIRLADCETGFPAYVIEQRKASCFSANMLIASLLIECGIEYKKLFFCSVHKASNNLLGAHGPILFQSATGKLKCIDFSFGKVGENFPIRLAVEGKGKLEELNKLRKNKKNEAVIVEFTDEVAEGLGVHRYNQVITLQQGLTSQHLHNIAITFIHEQKWDQAEYALQIALSCNTQDPEILYQLGFVKIKQGDMKAAEIYFKKSIQTFPEHLVSQYSLGEICLDRNDVQAAKAYFKVVVDNKLRIWGDDSYRIKSEEFLNMSDESLLAYWKSLPLEKI